MTKLDEFGVDTGAFIIADPAFAGEVAKAPPRTGQVNFSLAPFVRLQRDRRYKSNLIVG